MLGKMSKKNNNVRADPHDGEGRSGSKGEMRGKEKEMGRTERKKEIEEINPASGYRKPNVDELTVLSFR